ncbi:MAG: group I intron-associated PD-(D/E)XK endonuclease [Acidobacteriota bacterium]|nr:group I intron-associated PD-(D/E)XK endonuclease [Acidobacteriota bacterium]
MISDNPNIKGTLGEAAVCKDLLRLEFNVFLEFGNHSKVDLIVLDKNFNAIKVQIKAVQSLNDCVSIYSVKNCLNPKYNSTYTVKQVDVFAVYIIDKDLVFYVSAKEILQNGKSSKFRFSSSKNGQKKFVRYVDDYMDFKKALRDYTPHAQTAFGCGR